MSWDDAVVREAAWHTSDPPPGGTFNTAPALQVANGGKFDVVQAYVPYSDPRGRSLYIYRGGSMPQDEEGMTFGGLKKWKHHFVALILWPLSGTGGAGKLEDEMAARDAAISDVLTRIRGPLGDKTHNSQFDAVGEEDGDIRVIPAMDDFEAARQGGPFTIRIHYTATEHFAA